MHGYARFRLVGEDASDVPGERRFDEAPQPLPFPTCVRRLPRGGGAGDPLAALDQVTLSFEKFLRVLEGERRRAEIEGNGRDDGPRAA